MQAGVYNDGAPALALQLRLGALHHFTHGIPPAIVTYVNSELVGRPLQVEGRKHGGLHNVHRLCNEKGRGLCQLPLFLCVQRGVQLQVRMQLRMGAERCAA